MHRIEGRLWQVKLGGRRCRGGAGELLLELVLELKLEMERGPAVRGRGPRARAFQRSLGEKLLERGVEVEEQAMAVGLCLRAWVLGRRPPGPVCFEKRAMMMTMFRGEMRRGGRRRRRD